MRSKSCRPEPRGRLLRLLALAFVVGVSGGPARAAIAWDQTRVQLTATAGDPDIIAYFRFRNRGPKPVTIVAARPDCECTHAVFTPGAIAAGAGGVVKAVFTVGERVGPQRKTILVYDDATPDAPSKLTLEVNIAEVVSYQPRLAHWRIGEQPVEKVLDLVPTGPRSIKSLDGPQPVAGLSARLERLDNGRRYRLHLLPQSTAQRQSVVVHCTARLDDGATAPVTVFAIVR